VIVETSRERAFRVFTSEIDRWWPRHYHIGKSPLKQAIIEPRVGGRWYAICADGTECDTGKVLTWDPPKRLVLAWQINAEWRHDPTFLTEVEVTFTEEGPRRTRVELEHRNLERFGPSAPDLRAGIGAAGGWTLILSEYATVAKG
jgi:uncharacterized protein YndB with AHSA1/START domain